jgi:hypothetical protein
MALVENQYKQHDKVVHAIGKSIQQIALHLVLLRIRKRVGLYVAAE